MFNLSIVTPAKVFFEAQVSSVMVPGADGYFEVLMNHAAIIALLQKGKVRIIDKEKRHRICYISDGFFEFSDNKASLLADAVLTDWEDEKKEGY